MPILRDQLQLMFQTPPSFSGIGRLPTCIFAALMLVHSSGCKSEPDATTTDAGKVTTVANKFDTSKATYVGRDACISCHKDQAAKFAGSHHDHAMQPANESSVLADFDNATLTHHGITSRMFREGDKFMVHTEGPDGKMTDFQVQYVFGLEPLQQYMVEMPASGQEASAGEVPRVQVLRLSWDTEKKEWFYLPPPDVPEKLAPNDDLHWTGIAQRWNTMCADCHSTNYQKNFSVPESHSQLVSAQKDATFESLVNNESAIEVGKYSSTFVEIDVSCESCHGPGSVHVELAKQWFPGWSRERGYGLADLKATAENQIQACAPCHSRRNVVSGGFKAGDNFYDHFTNQLLAEDIYYPDGQILDEDYVHGSFIQSKMYHKGIRCSDCHDPHSARLKHNGNQVCTSCHQHPVAKYDSVSHHFHAPDSPGAQCVNCHMPATTYMEVDSRRDHSLRVPRPDVSLKIGTPNACTGCHLDPQNVDESKREDLTLYQDWMLAARQGDAEVQAEITRANQWCDDACEKWYGENRRRDTHYGEAIAAAQNQAPDAAEKVAELLSKSDFSAPALARATALAELSQIDPAAAATHAQELIQDPNPLVRTAATDALVGSSNLNLAVSLLESALKDPVRSVRIQAARNILNFPPNAWNERAAASLRNALVELADGLEFSNDRSGAHMSLGILAEQQGRRQQALKHYADAVAVEPLVTGPRTNLAALLEANLSQQSGNSAIREKLTAEVQRLRKEEMRLLRRDVELLPESAAIQYRYGLALYLNRSLVDNALQESAEHLVRAAEIDPAEPQFAQAAAMIFQELEQWDDALKWARDGLQRSAGDAQYQLLYQQIQAAAAKASP